MSKAIAANKLLYRPALWSQGLVDIDDQGNTIVRLDRTDIPLNEIVRRIRRFGWDLPAVVRFPTVITTRARSLETAFVEAIKESNYQATYSGMYPLKVNPMAHVVKTFLSTTSFGLEAGSKAELIEALSLAIPAGRPVVLNGHKDDPMLRLVIESTRLGHRVLPIIETPTEFIRLHELGKQLKHIPVFGVRARLHSRSSGRWEDSAGERAKFGLSTTELIELVENLRKKDLLDHWELLHFHIGSQVPQIRHINRAVREAARIYCRLVKLGVGLQTIDIGGGLGVDYDGSRSSKDSSVNYSVEEYADSVVWTLAEVCREEGVTEPDIISESGRYLVADHAVLLVESLGRNEVRGQSVPKKTSDEHDLVKDLRTCLKDLRKGNVLQSLHEARQFKEDSLQLFDLGFLSLIERSAVESLYWSVLEKSLKHLNGTEKLRCSRELADQVIINFSLFQSLPDYWAVDHNFPIMPIERLDQTNDHSATLVDITCDSDGTITHFVGPEGEDQRTLRLSSNGQAGDVYGVFLIGAYQDILGDLHNLFGPVNEVEVKHKHKGGFNVGKLDRGCNVSETLELMHLEPETLKNDLLAALDLSDQRRSQVNKILKRVLSGTTYFDPRP